MLTNRSLLEIIAAEQRYTFISTGMSTIEEIKKAIDIFQKAECPYELMHCNSSYPMPITDANLNNMKTLASLGNQTLTSVGYSGHESGVIVSVAAVAMGATSIERHITLDRSMYGSDQSASLELAGLNKLVKYIRDVELSLGSYERNVTDTEKEIAKKLRKVNSL